MKIVSTKNAPAAIGPYSQGIFCDGFYFFSGQIALDKNGKFCGDSLETEISQILKNIAALLAAENLSKKNILKTTIFLTKISDFEIVNKFYGEFFGDHFPARSTVAVAALPKNARVEIEFVAKK